MFHGLSAAVYLITSLLISCLTASECISIVHKSSGREESYSKREYKRTAKSPASCSTQFRYFLKNSGRKIHTKMWKKTAKHLTISRVHSNKHSHELSGYVLGVRSKAFNAPFKRSSTISM